MENNSSKKIWLILAIILIVIVAGSAVYYFFFKPSDSMGVNLAREMMIKYPQLVKKTSINQQIQGNIKAINGSSWTIINNSQTLTVTNDGTNKILFNKVESVATNSAQTVTPKLIKAENIQIGDNVLINRTLDWQTGKSFVSSIIVLPQK